MLDLTRTLIVATLITVALNAPQGAIADSGNDRVEIKALYIPLADHYAALVAYEKYADEMVHADFEIQKMKTWTFLRAYFESGEAEMAFVMSPLAMRMFQENPNFRWIGLMHRDGNALAINDLLASTLSLSQNRKNRKPDEQVALAMRKINSESHTPIEVGVPHVLATHTVVLYRYLMENGLSLTHKPNVNADVLAIAVAPAKSPAFLRSKGNRAQPAAFEQSLPWADIVETGGFGHVAWYSKDVMPWPDGHVECIALATDTAIDEKYAALREVMTYIHRAGRDIEHARQVGGPAMDELVAIVRKHIPAHTAEAIVASLDPDLRVINYQNLNVDRAGLKQIMDWAVKGGIMDSPIDIDAFVHEGFDVPATAVQ